MMKAETLILLILGLPLTGMVFTFVFSSWKRAAPRVSWLISGVVLLASFCLLNLVRSGDMAVIEVGGWPIPYGITLIADAFAGLMLAVCNVIFCAVLLYARESFSNKSKEAFFYPLTMALQFGVNGAFLTADLFNLYVFFEVILLSSFALIALGRSRANIVGSLKYIVLNLVASFLFLASVGLIYAKVGSLYFGEIATRLAVSGDSMLVGSSAMMLLCAFSIKAALFPFYFWLPASYPSAPIAVTALFAGILTKVGIYALFRCFGSVFVHDIALTHGGILFWLACLTMMLGVFGAAAQMNIQRILSFHIISQIGYMALGLALFTVDALAAGIFYIVHHIVVKTNLFFVGGWIERRGGTGELRSLGGLLHTAPFLAILFLVPALSLAGIPPLSGFWAKFALLRATLGEGAIFGAVCIVLVGFLTLYSMMKIWSEVFWKSDPAQQGVSRVGLSMKIPVIGLALITLAIGFYPEPLFEVSKVAAQQVLGLEVQVSEVIKK